MSTYSNDGHDHEQHHHSGIQQPSHVAASEEDAHSTAGLAAASTLSSSHWDPLDGDTHHAGFSPFVAFCFTINFILGTGFLTIPWAFVQSGLVLSVILLVISAFISDMAKDYLLETMARAEAMLDSEMHFIPKKSNEELMTPSIFISNDEFKDEEDEDDRQHLEPNNREQTSKQQSTILENGDGMSEENERQQNFSSSLSPLEIDNSTNDATTQQYMVKNRKFEVNTLCRTFLGQNGVTAFTVFICLYMVGILWAYTSVFASAMTDALPLSSTNDNLNYILYAIVFGSIVVPLSCLELDEQVTVQVIMTGCRFLMLFLMIGTSHLCANDAEQRHGENDNAPMFRFQGLHQTLPILVVANMYHPAIPGLSFPVENKKALGTIFRSTSIFTSFAYSVIGVVMGSAFGKGVEESSNLNWKGFGSGGDGSWWEEAVSFYIILFPALDVMSAFPLNAITLGNNMFGAYYGDRVHEIEHSNRGAKVGFRLLASVPPVIGALFVRELGEITDYVGTTGFIIGFSIPALLFHQSKSLAKRTNYSTTTYFTSYASKGPLATIVFWFGIVMVVVVLTSLIFF